MGNDVRFYEQMPQEAGEVRILFHRDISYAFRAHWHEHTEIHYLLEGNGLLRYSDETLALKAGDCVVINGNELHQGGGGRATYFCLILSPAYFENNHVILKKNITDDFVKETVERIASLCPEKGRGDLLELQGLTYLLTAHLTRNYTLKEMDAAVYSGEVKKRNMINLAISYINENYGTHLSTKDLAEMVHLSEGYFCQLFREVTGRSAIDYLNRLRIDKAEQILEQTDVTVSEAAYCCGFEDANYFSRMFKKIKGVSPNGVRRSAERTKG
ncbi:MAG: AraC family transcriptional regulator [Clostridia bacterium]|nr:AraC family transcriptional regulator [Clostridia bacterium]